MGLSSHWRRSRWLQALAAVDPFGRIPVVHVELFFARLARILGLLVGGRVRLGAFLRTIRLRPRLGLLFGRWSPRLFFDPRVGARLLSASAATLPLDGSLLSPDPASSGAARKIRIAVYASSLGNFFHTEMAELLAHSLAASGSFEVVRRNEQSAPCADVDEHLVLAPHEFFGLGTGSRLLGAAQRGFRRHCTLFLAEQPGTKHFAMCLPLAAESRLVLDLNPRSAALLRAVGLPATFFPLGWVPDFPAYQDGAAAPEGLEDRPIEVLFNGVRTPRRVRFFARNAAFFAERRCQLWMPTPHEPLGVQVPSTLGTVAATASSRQARILLNVHREERSYFEWHRIMIRGVWQKTLVVSEPCHPPPGFEPGVHLLEAPLGELAELMRWLLETREGRERAECVRDAAFAALRREFDGLGWARALATWYLEAAR